MSYDNLYVKKQATVEAHQHTGSNTSASRIKHWVDGGPAPYKGGVETCDICSFEVLTLAGSILVNPGDWVLKHADGVSEVYPKDLFDGAYQKISRGMRTETLTFGEAIYAMRLGRRLTRPGWNGKDMFVYLVPPASYPVQSGAAKEHFGEGSMVPYNAYFAIKNVDDTVSTWVPSVNDCLASDWMILP